MFTRDRASYAILCVLAAAAVSAAAPVPKSLKARPPAELTADVLEGRWRVDWGLFEGGWIEFYGNGSYAAKYHADAEAAVEFLGFWEVKAGWGLLLTEYKWFDPTATPVKYDLLMTGRGWPDLCGTVGSADFHHDGFVPAEMAFEVKLSGRKAP